MTILRALFLAALLPIFSVAQALPDMGASRDTGVKPYMPYGGVNENINLTNGNLNLTVPLLHLPGRNGFDLNLALFYNSKIWNLYGGYNAEMDILNVTWEAAIPSHQPWLDIAQGWKLGIPTVTYSTVWDGQAIHDCSGQVIVTLSDGAKSVFNNRYGCDTAGSPQSPNYPIDADDSTGMRLTNSGTDLVVTMRNGTKIHFPSSGGGVATKMVDASGNVISFAQTTNTVTITDTVGRIVTVDTSSSPITITYKNSNGSSRTISLTLGSNSPSCSFSYPIQNIHQAPPLYVHYNTSCAGLGALLSSVSIPTADSSHPQVYSFNYNSFAELSQINYPTGGYTKYGYGPVTHLESFVMLTAPEDGTVVSDFREMGERRVCRNFNNSCTSGQEDVTTYTPTVNVNQGYNQYMDVRDPAGNRTRHEFTDGVIPGDSSPSHQGMSPHEVNVFYYSGESTLLKTVHTVYDDIYAWSLPTTITTTLNDVSPNLVKQEALTYDTFTVNYLPYPSDLVPEPTATTATRDINNELTHTESDWGSGSAGSTLRSTTNTWVKTNVVYGSGTAVDYFSDAVRILSLKATEKLYDGTTLKAETDYEYDKNSLTTSSAINRETPANGNARGKVTKVKRWRDTDNTWPYSTYNYDDAGNVLSSTDPGGHNTTLDWTDNWGNTTCAPSSGQTKAYLKTITNALSHVTTLVNNSCTGTLYSVTDPNLQPTSYAYDDLDRLSTTTFPDGGGSTNTYTELGAASGHGFYVTASTKQDSTTGHNIVTDTEIDGLGRVVQTRHTSDPQGTVFTDTTYDAFGRTYQVYNPYRSGDSTYYTQTAYDALGRVTSVTKQDGSYESDEYAGNFHTHYDEAGRFRGFRTDGLDRLGFVYEENPSSATWAYSTYYYYDVLGNLLSVNQQGDGTGTARTRTFTYNSLSQLTRATNPESGSICYGTESTPGTLSTCDNLGYDADGNLVYKTDARGVKTTLTYDNIHRLTDKSYTIPSGSSVATSYEEVFTYDESGHLGHLTMMGTRVGPSAGWIKASQFSYDVMGRPNWQVDYCIPVVSYTCYGMTTATYNLAGAITSLTYPSGRVVNFASDAAGRLSDVNASFSGTAYHYYQVPSGGFLPSGTVATVNLGNGLQENTALNVRLQPCHYTLWQLPSTLMLDRRQLFGNETTSCSTSVAGNNGNVMELWDANAGRIQTFTYDYLNRITSAHTQATTGPDAWSQTFTYDAWGNMNQAGSLIFSQSFGSNNRISSGSYTYDAAGDLTADGTHTYAFDAESQIATVDASGSTPTTYTYDSSGQRVRKTTGSNYTEYVYFGGEPIAEKDQSGAWTDYIFAGSKRVAMATGTASTGTTYFHSDSLGSQRLMTAAVPDGSGNIVVTGTDRTYLPFGWEWNATTAGSHYKFTGKERDAETNNDYFGARYYNASMGRWLSPDWSAAPAPIPYADMSDPQSLNLYGYVRNRPTFAVDGDGHCPCASDLANYLDAKINVFNQDGLAANKSASPAVAALNTFANGVTGDLGRGFTNLLRTGESVGSLQSGASTTQVVLAVSQEGGRVGGTILLVTAAAAPKGGPTGNTLKPGPNAGESIPASGPKITPAEQAQINRIGDASGCHTCSAETSGTKSGNWVGDHQPPNALNSTGGPQSLYPQCLHCSQIQGGQVRAAQVNPPPPATPNPILPVVNNEKH